MIGKPMSKESLNATLAKPRICARYKEGCGGRLTIEHPFGRSSPLAHHCIWLCELHHGLGAYWSKKHFDKLLNKHIAYKDISDEELAKLKLAKAFLQEKEFLAKRYGDIHK